ncbi:hypothetical protein ACFLRC_04440, partial [Candidatus Altiarchaeota archaeon]
SGKACPYTDVQTLRSNPGVSLKLNFKDGKAKIEQGKEKVLSDELRGKTEKAIDAITEYARKTGHKKVTSSYVTYRDRPNKPEFYDLLLGACFP